MIAELERRAVERMGTIIMAFADGPARTAFETLWVAMRVRLGERGAGELLAGLEVQPRMAALELIAANQPATPELGALVETVVWKTTTFAQLSDRHLVLWASLSLGENAGEAVVEARLDETNSADRVRIFGRLILAGVPATASGVLGLADALVHEVEVDALVTGFLGRQWVKERTELSALLARVRSPGAKLEAVIGQVLLGADSAELNALTDVGAVVRDAAKTTTGHRQVGLARQALWVHLGGGDPSGLWAQAYVEAARESEPAMAARTQRVMLECAAATSFARWAEVVERIAEARLFLRDGESWLALRADIVRTARRAVRSESELDRAHQSLKELGRRLPNRWFDLFHFAAVAEMMGRWGRSNEVVLSEVDGWLTRDGLPRPVVQITIEEVVGALAKAVPTRVLGWGERLPSPAQQVVWLSGLAGRRG